MKITNFSAVAAKLPRGWETSEDSTGFEREMLTTSLDQLNTEVNTVMCFPLRFWQNTVNQTVRSHSHTFIYENKPETATGSFTHTQCPTHFLPSKCKTRCQWMYGCNHQYRWSRSGCIPCYHYPTVQTASGLISYHKTKFEISHRNSVQEKANVHQRWPADWITHIM